MAGFSLALAGCDAPPTELLPTSSPSAALATQGRTPQVGAQPRTYFCTTSRRAASPQIAGDEAYAYGLLRVRYGRHEYEGDAGGEEAQFLVSVRDEAGEVVWAAWCRVPLSPAAVARAFGRLGLAGRSPGRGFDALGGGVWEDPGEHCQGLGQYWVWDPDLQMCVYAPPPPPPSGPPDCGSDPACGDDGSGGGGTPPPPPPPEEDCPSNDPYCDYSDDDLDRLCRVSYASAEVIALDWHAEYTLITETTFLGGGACPIMPEIRHAASLLVVKNGSSSMDLLPDDYTLEPDGMKMTWDTILGFWCATLQSGRVEITSQHNARFSYFRLGGLLTLPPRPPVARGDEATC